jgi:DNA-binding IclR family transcriptional regulator
MLLLQRFAFIAQKILLPVHFQSINVIFKPRTGEYQRTNRLKLSKQFVTRERSRMRTIAETEHLPIEDPTKNTQTYHLASVDRVMRLLSCFTKERPNLRLTDLSQQLGLPKATVLRIASTLEQGGFLERDPVTKHYRLGLALFHLGMVVQHGLDIRRVVQPYLHQLVEAIGETARLVVPADAGPVCVDLVESPHSIRVYAQLGSQLPWNAGASAKVILAYLPPEESEKILARAPLRRFTERTTVDIERLREELCIIRKQGYHIGIGDLDTDATGISAPIFNGSGELAGTINVSGPSNRLAGEEAESATRIIVHAAQKVSTALGFQPSASHS